MKSKYIDLIELVFNAYTDEHIHRYTKDVKERGIWEHGYPRLTANLGILIAHGKKLNLKDTFIEMMDICCSGMYTARFIYECNTGHDFSIKEIVLCLLELEKNNVFDKQTTDKWRQALSEINPFKAYNVVATLPLHPMGNWPAFSAFSEQMRTYANISDEAEFIDNQIATLLFSFDENGMFRDPDEPMVYDFVTRLQIAGILYFGYNGKHKNELNSHMEKAAEPTLLMQSVNGEIPYGGRSNQFLHNETFYAALCEYYAQEYKKRGNISKAMEFKYAAKRAMDYVIPWFEDEHKTHIKNYYPIDSNYGCEVYAYYDKYMITAASWIYMAYVFADDTIPLPENCGNENYIYCTSEPFHKVFCKFGDYFTETDTKADMHYDASGIGRIHKKGVPSALCLTTPFPEHSTYCLDIENSSPLSICGGIVTPDGPLYAYDTDTKYTLTDSEITKDCVRTTFLCTLKNGESFIKTSTVSKDGVEIVIEGNGNLEILFPVFEFDGSTKTKINSSPTSVTVQYKGSECRFTTDNTVTDRNEIYANRNGHYKKFAITGKDRITLKIELI